MLKKTTAAPESLSSTIPVTCTFPRPRRPLGASLQLLTWSRRRGESLSPRGIPIWTHRNHTATNGHRGAEGGKRRPWVQAPPGASWTCCPLWSRCCAT